MCASTFRKLQAYTRYSHSPNLRFSRTKGSKAILQASRQHALSPLSSKLAANMCYHIAPAYGRHASPPSSKRSAVQGQHAPTPSFKRTANIRQPALQHSSSPTAVHTSNAGHPLHVHTSSAGHPLARATTSAALSSRIFNLSLSV
jgi:hypothetical protein